MPGTNGNGDQFMTVQACERIHEGFEATMQARFDESKADREILHEQTQGIFSELKLIRWGVITTAGSIIAGLMTVVGVLAFGGGFAPNKAVHDITKELAIISTKLDSHLKDQGNIKIDLDEIKRIEKLKH